MSKCVFFSLLFLIACQTRQEQKANTAPDATQPSIQDTTGTWQRRQNDKNRMDSLAAIVKAKPVWGERLTVIGDFDGDGKQDTLYEQYISLLTGKETNKDYDFSGSELGEGCCDWLDYKQRWIVEQVPLVRLASNNPAIRSFDIESGGAQNGIDYLKNVGDLNGDSRDEIVYYIYDVDYSSMNSCALATYKNGKWKEVHHWDISENDFIYNEDGSKPDPVYIRRKNGKVYCREMADDWSGFVWKQLKTNW